MHSEIITLGPSTDLYIECSALSQTHISQYNNKLGILAGQGQIIVNGKIINKNQVQKKPSISDTSR